MRKLFFFFLPVLIVAACSNEEPAKTKTDSSGKDSVAKKNVASDWRSLTESWSASLNLKNASIMKSFYADTVLYYGNKISGDEVIKSQQAYFAANSDYKLKILEYLGEEQQPDGNWRVRITKQVTAGGKTANYPSSLIFGNRGGIWKIISESDDITDLRQKQ